MEHPQGMHAANLIQSVIKALDVLECLAPAEMPLFVRQVAEHCGFSRPTAYQLPSTLRSWNHVQNTHDGHYQIGIGILYVDRAPGPQSVHMYCTIGTRNPLHCTAMGKAIFAFIPPERRDEILARVTRTQRTSHRLDYDPSPPSSAMRQKEAT